MFLTHFLMVWMTVVWTGRAGSAGLHHSVWKPQFFHIPNCRPVCPQTLTRNPHNAVLSFYTQSRNTHTLVQDLTRILGRSHICAITILKLMLIRENILRALTECFPSKHMNISNTHMYTDKKGKGLKLTGLGRWTWSSFGRQHGMMGNKRMWDTSSETEKSERASK